MSKLYLSHITSFSYSNFVVESSNQIILYPYNDANQQVISHSLKITGNPNIYTNFDWYGNKVGFFNYLLPHKNLSIESEAEILVKKVELPKNELNIKESWNQINKLKSENIDFFEFTHCADNANKKAKKALKKMDLKNLSPFELVLKLNKYVYENFKYKKGITKVDTSVDKVWELGLGVCQDFTNVLLQLCRLSNIPSRYVSGYVCSSERIRGDGATHSWVEVYIPNHGWVGIDPTNNCICQDLHVKIGIGRNYNDCAPVKGVYKGNEEQKMDVKVNLSTKKLIVKQTKSVWNEKTIEKEDVNSYQKNLEMIQQQQQQ